MDARARGNTTVRMTRSMPPPALARPCSGLFNAGAEMTKGRPRPADQLSLGLRMGKGPRPRCSSVWADHFPWPRSAHNSLTSLIWIRSSRPDVLRLSSRRETQ